MRFAERTGFGEDPSPYGSALQGARARSGFIDLTVSNPTRCGFDFAADRLLPPLADPQAMLYEADPLGLLTAREAVSKLYRDSYGADVPPGQLLLTASTSEAYSHLLRLFCEPGDNILVPSPSYPLFDLLARLHDVELTSYPLVYHDGWQIDPASLAAAVTPRTKAIVAVHPNNPTGHYCSDRDRDALYAVSLQHGLPLIVDEVFLDHRFEQGARAADRCSTFAKRRWDQAAAGLKAEAIALTFVLGGLSKLLAMPQMKLAWTVVCGPVTEVAQAMHRLEVIADTFLSVATPPQVALPAWLAERSGVQAQILERLQANLLTLDQVMHGSVISRLRVEGGWSVILRVPAIEPDTGLAVRLLRDHGVATHPGSFYGFAETGWLVISLLPPVDQFSDGLRRLLSAF